MQVQRIVHSLAGTAIAAAGLVASSSPAAHAADLDVDVYRGRPVYVAPAPRVYVAPTRVVTVGPACVTRRARVWVGDHYVTRTVRRCW
jgi:hypothetical protein